MLKQTYQQEEAEQISKEAARREFEAATADSRPIPHERLVAMAEELGISLETLNAVLAEKAGTGTAAAQQQQAAQAETGLEAQRKAFITERRAEFMEHFWSYAGVNTFLILIYLMTSSGSFWPMWVILSWGLGIFFHAVYSLPTSGPTFERDFEAWREKQRRKEERKLRDRERAKQKRAKKAAAEAAAETQETESGTIQTQGKP